MRDLGAPWRRVEIELSGNPAPVDLAPGDGGVAAILRHQGAFVGLALRARDKLPGGRLEPQSLIDQDVRAAMVADGLRARVAGGSGEGQRTRSLSVAICTKDGAARVARLLDTLLPLRGETPFEVLVIDNGPSDDSTQKVVEGRTGVRYFLEPLVGLDFARNRAVREATGEVLAFLDDDVTVDVGWARSMVRTWADNPDAGIVTGLVLPLETETEAQILFELGGGFRRGFLPLRFGQTAPWDAIHPCGAGKFGAGANMSVDLALVRSIGGFDEALDTGRPLPGGGDLDIFYRTLRTGRMLVYEPQAAVFHEHRRATSALSRQYGTWGLGLMAFIAKIWRSDRAMRPAQGRLVIWWFVWMLRRLLARTLGRGAIPVGMIGRELIGGIGGLLGEYGRSERRSEQLRKDTA